MWSFNYTDPHKILTQLDINHSIPNVEHIHGTLAKRDAIVGFQSDANVDGSYSYMKKMSNPNHSFSGWGARLRSAQTVLIFGHSLGDSDKEYFTDYLEFLASQDSMDTVRRLIFVTYDEVSKSQILNNIERMTNGKLANIKAHVKLGFYETRSGLIDFTSILEN